MYGTTCPVGMYLLKVNNRNTIVNFKHVIADTVSVLYTLDPTVFR